ncbi:disulfide oxidoreductase [Planococcus lenghuensis]|uniref:Disulfide bond formation protein B n=1 Tax=Planococcus lenghuensis TaxID=2213202 RepID=A0A1Q2KWG9_9BACL|nr:disulfide oxidoreductase [Planococcus lenghuensis]AQQ52529.1 disulfide bond formation protein B [Planococcus lenghuensis]
MTKHQENALLLMWAAALVATAGSLYFSEVRDYLPCELCWYQRILMYPLVIVLGVAYIQKNPRIALTALIMSVAGGGISLYHYGIQKVAFLQDSASFCGQVPCTGQYINWFGFITIPFLAFIAFSIIAGASIYVLKTLKED